MSIINIGELVKNLSVGFKEAYPDVPWRKTAGMRDIAVYGYHAMDNSIIWNVAANSIPELLSFLEKTLSDMA